MIGTLRQLDRILRGQATDLPTLQTGRLDIPVFGISFVLIALGMIYGICMGVFSLTGGGSGQSMQVVASMLKVPALFLLTLLVTFPSLYVFTALSGSPLHFGSMLRLLVGTLAVTMAVLSSIGPIVAFFSVTSKSYSFIVLLNVVVFTVAGVLGIGFLIQTLHRMYLAAQRSWAPPAASATPATPPPMPQDEVNEDSQTSEPVGALDRPTSEPLSGSARSIFRIWMIVFGLVGMQMAWVLRPFIGHPNQRFEWFRQQGGNFFESVYSHIQHLVGVG